jgi:hypothetical protein
MRLGKVQIGLEYIVDLDNVCQVELAREFIHDDLAYAIKYDEVDSHIEIVEDASLTEADINQNVISPDTDGEGD